MALLPSEHLKKNNNKESLFLFATLLIVAYFQITSFFMVSNILICSLIL